MLLQRIIDCCDADGPGDAPRCAGPHGESLAAAPTAAPSFPLCSAIAAPKQPRASTVLCNASMLDTDHAANQNLLHRSRSARGAPAARRRCCSAAPPSSAARSCRASPRPARCADASLPVLLAWYAHTKLPGCGGISLPARLNALLMASACAPTPPASRLPCECFASLVNYL